jgi:hypothetical protein
MLDMGEIRGFQLGVHPKDEFYVVPKEELASLPGNSFPTLFNCKLPTSGRYAGKMKAANCGGLPTLP